MRSAYVAVAGFLLVVAALLDAAVGVPNPKHATQFPTAAVSTPALQSADQATPTILICPDPTGGLPSSIDCPSDAPPSYWLRTFGDPHLPPQAQ
jgi:hypothetical protein